MADWAAIEAVLTRAQRRQLAEAARLLGIDASAWARIPSLRGLYGAIAPLQFAEQLEAELGVRWEAAVVEACLRLGFKPDSYLRMIRRARRDARAGKASATLPRSGRAGHRSAA